MQKKDFFVVLGSSVGLWSQRAIQMELPHYLAYDCLTLTHSAWSLNQYGPLSETTSQLLAGIASVVCHLSL